MRKNIGTIFISILFMLAGLSASTQRIQPVQISVQGPYVVNFQQLAEYELIHPLPQIQRLIEQGEDKEEGFHFTPKTIATDEVRTFNIQRNQSRATVNSPAPILSFNGIADNSTLIPPDINGATGPVYVMETTNQQFRIFNKVTGALAYNLGIGSLLSPTNGSGYYDPHVLYDPNYGRFVLVVDGTHSDGNSGMFVAVSHTSDPRGAWYVYSFDAAGNSDFIDYPMLGLNNNWVVITGNNFPAGGGSHSNIYVLNRASLYSGTLGTVSSFSDNNAFGMAPAQTFDSTQQTEYLVQDANGNQGGMGYMQICTITGSVNAPVYTAGNTIGVNQPWSENFNGASQLGNNNLLEDGDTRTGNAVYRNGNLWFCHTVVVSGHDAIDWWEVDPAGNSVIQFGRVEDPNSIISYYYCNMSINSVDDAFISFDESSSGMYSGAAYALRLHTDALNTMESPYDYKDGRAGYFKDLGGGRNRWGDFNGSAVDPVDNTFWAFGQFADTNNLWGTVIAHVGDSMGSCSAHAAFITSNTTNCSAPYTVNFTSTSLGTDTYFWDFGDGFTSTQQNPSHTYTVPGNYSVSLIGSSVTCGTDSTQQASIIHINNDAPVASNVSICSGQTATLNATSPGSIDWYTQPTGGSSLATGTSYTTGILSNTTTYYAQATIASPPNNAGPANHSFGAGSYNTFPHYLIFNNTTAQTLISIMVDANSAGARTIELHDASDTQLASATVNLTTGIQTVTLNFSIPAGNGLRLGIWTGTEDLYRNSSGSNYPYNSTDATVSITGNDVADLARYYFFYNWQLQVPGCITSRTAVTVNVLNGGQSFNAVPVGMTVNFTPSDLTGSSYSWNFGDGQTSTLASPFNTYTANGTYTVTLIEVFGSCTDTLYQTVTVGGTGINETSGLENISLFPNPANTTITISLNTKQSDGCKVNIRNVLGETVLNKDVKLNSGSNSITLDVSSLSSGVYFLSFDNGKGTATKRFVKAN